jgi:MFS family permease
MDMEPGMSGAATTSKEITTDIPARMDRLPWSKFHLLVVVALGVTWVLDGLEVTLVGSIGPILRDKQTLSLTDQDIGSIAACYVGGAVAGALLFGWLTDRFGRRMIFNLTLGIYMVGVLLTAFAWNFWSFACFNCITGLGIGGEYAAINSAIDELIPARLRGRIDLIVNGSYWAGAAVGAGGSLLLLSGRLVGIDVGWRLGFGIGAVLSGLILFLRRYVPESPRWQITHGREAEAKQTTSDIERKVGKDLPPPRNTLKVHPRKVFGFGLILGAMMGKNRSRSVLALSLMVAQAFLFNAVFFTYGLVLATFYHVQEARTGVYILPLAAGNFLGPLLLGHLFDTVGRKKMIAGTYGLSGLLVDRRCDPVRDGRADRLDTDDLLDGDLLRRLRRGEFRLSDGQRDFPVGNQSDGDRFVLCPWYPNWRGQRAVPVRSPDRIRQPMGGGRGIYRRRGADDRRRGMRSGYRRRGRRQIAGGRRPATVIHGLNAHHVRRG